MVKQIRKIKLYLDNCCYNRPFDDQNQIRINIETTAKLYIQGLIVNKEVDMVWSYILFAENYDNPFEQRKEAILDFAKNAVEIIVENDEILKMSKNVRTTGIKEKDSLHIACAIYANCDYFITTDDRITKYRDENINIVSPVEFLKLWEDVNSNE
jgi:predicted nucleic acid-binding protein